MLRPQTPPSPQTPLFSPSHGGTFARMSHGNITQYAALAHGFFLFVRCIRAPQQAPNKVTWAEPQSANDDGLITHQKSHLDRRNATFNQSAWN